MASYGILNKAPLKVAVVGPVFGVSDDETGQLVALAFAKAEAAGEWLGYLIDSIYLWFNWY